jgi:hypothetical protein
VRVWLSFEVVRIYLLLSPFIIIIVVAVVVVAVVAACLTLEVQIKSGTHVTTTK